MKSSFYVYILSNKTRSVFYIGVTNDLDRRLYEHQNGMADGFSKKYVLQTLIYYEEYPSINEAIEREKQLKNWHRGWKLNLIRQKNPELKDLNERDPETSSG